MHETIVDSDDKQQAHRTPAGSRTWGARQRWGEQKSVLVESGVLRDSPDASKYVFASEEISRFMNEHGFKYVSRVVSPLSIYNVYVVDHVYTQGSEDAYAKIIATIKRWDSYRVVGFPRLVLESEELLKKLGTPVSHLVHLLAGAEGVTRFVEDTEKRVEAAGDAQLSSVSVSGRYNQYEKRLMEREVPVNIQTVRAAMVFVLENINTPTILVLDGRELELIGASSILKATVANKNLVVLVYDFGESDEVKKLLDSGRATLFISGFPEAVSKAELVNMCIAMSRELSPRLLDIGGRKGTRAGVSATITLLAETNVLGKVAGYFVSKFSNQYVAFTAMSYFISMFYARFARSPENVLEDFRKLDEKARRAFVYSLVREALKTAEQVASEVSRKFYMRQPFNSTHRNQHAYKSLQQ